MKSKKNDKESSDKMKVRLSTTVASHEDVARHLNNWLLIASTTLTIQ